jgi:predicted metal-binding protein
MRKRKGRFDRYPIDEELHLVGLVHCAGCPTIVAPGKILKRIRSLVDYRIDALHFSYCMTALCPFIGKYEKEIKSAYPELFIIHGTHQPVDTANFRQSVKELLCPTVRVPQDMNDVIQRKLMLCKSDQK